MDSNPKERSGRTSGKVAIVGGAVFLASAVVALAMWMTRASTSDEGSSTVENASAEGNARGGERLPALPPSVPGDPAKINGAPTSPVGNPVDPGPQPTVAERVENSMKVWRNAIINKDAEPVERLDRTFAENPAVFLNALMSSAESDPEPRVRAFSTRVLGKLRQPDATTLLRRLLADKSEFVRFNAAWALGELGDAQAVAKLRVLAKRDPAPAVRQSAHQTLMKLGGT